MHVKLHVLASFRYLDIEKPFSINGLLFTKDHTVLSKYFTPPLLAKLGTLRANAISRNTVLAHWDVNLMVENEEEAINSLSKTARVMNDGLNGVMNSLWFIKDCCCNLLETVFYYLEKDAVHVISNTELFSMADGQHLSVSFNEAEILQTNSILANLEEVYKSFQEEEYVPSFQDGTTKKHRPYNKRIRLERATDFMQQTRRHHLLPMKIAMYIPILESLFSDSGSDIAHKVAERTASYLGGTREEKLKVFDSVKQAYDIRSKILHGSTLSNKHDKLETQILISRSIDDVARKVLSKAINDFENFKSEQTTDFYRSLLFT